MNVFLRYRRETAAAAAAAAIALGVLWAPLSGLGSRPADAGQATGAAASFADEPVGPQPASAAELLDAAEPAPSVAPSAPTPPAPAAFDGRSLAAGGTAASPSGRYVLTMQDDGNLVLSDGQAPIWATGTSGGPAAMAIGADGNLAVLSAADGSVLWSTGMSGHGPAALGVQDDGNLVLADEAGTPVWDRHRGDLTRPVLAPPGASGQPATPRQQPAGQSAGGTADEPPMEPAAPQAPAGGSFESAVRAAVSALPGGGYGAVFHPYQHPENAAWGTTDLGSCEVWISASTPAGRVLDVVRHEYGHVLQCRAYGGDYESLIADAGGMSGTERIADAVALDLGAGWVNYTGSPTAFEWAAADQVMSGRRIG